VAGVIYFLVLAFNLSALLRPEYYAIYELMGRSYEAMGWYSDALSSYKKALSRNPEEANTWALLGGLYLRMNMHSERIFSRIAPSGLACPLRATG